MQQTQYQGLEKQIEQGSRDVKIVSEMKTTLDGCIDERAQGPLAGRIRDNLHLDNQTVHDDGASKMDQAVKVLIEQRQQLVQKNPDLKLLMDQPDIYANLKKLRNALSKALKRLGQLNRQAEDLKAQMKFNQDSIQQVQDAMEPDFDETAVQSQITTIQKQRDSLVIDDQLEVKYQAAQDAYGGLVKSERRLNSKKDKQQGARDAAQSSLMEDQSRLDMLTKTTNDALLALRPYVSADEKLTTVDEVLAFNHANNAEIRSSNYSQLVDYVGVQIHNNKQDGTDRTALDTIFAERGHGIEASQMRQQRTINDHGMTVVAFDINRAIKLIEADQSNVKKMSDQLEAGNNAAQAAYVAAAVDRIERQYRLIDEYNEMLNQGAKQPESIKLRITLTPSEVSDMVIAEARNPHSEKRDDLKAEVGRRLNKLANDLDVADDDEAFMMEAQDLLDTRNWSEFKVFIKRRQNREDEYEEVNDKFVQSGGSGAEKAQAMVLPLLLVPKMVLNQSSVTDAPHLVMFDEFADKLDPETAKSFARTIANFGFNFIATMPSGAQNKILADGIDNIAYDVIAPKQQQAGKFYRNTVRPALIWQKEAYHESLS